jgi:hypothetical protein
MNFLGAFNVSRAVLGILLGGFLFWGAPFYGMPFSGCDKFGWLVALPACSHWPEALRGFLFVLPMAVLAPARWMLPVFATVLLLLVAIAGGADSVRTGELHAFFQASMTDRFYYFWAGYPVFVGGLLASLPWAVAKAHAAKSARDVA